MRADDDFIMEALSDKCAFTDGWSKLIRDLALDTRSTFIFTMAGYETFEVLVFNHETGTQIYFKKVEVSEHKEKVTTNESDVDQDLAGDVVSDSMRLSSSYRSHNDPKGKSKFVFGDETVSPKVDPKVKSKVVVGDKGLSTKVELKGKSNAFVCDQNLSPHVVSQVIRMPLAEETSKSISTVDLHSFVVPREKNKANPIRNVVRSVIDTSHMAYCTRSKVPQLDDYIVLQRIRPAENKQAKPKCKASRSLTSIADDVGRKCSTSKKLKKHVVIEFAKKDENRLNEKCELSKLGTRAEKSGDGFRYGFIKWPAFLKSNHIEFGATLFFTYAKSSQRLMLTKVVHKIIKKRGRA
ncbi:hypothetical protein Hanom_Chr07g00655471 [Helianthus anomalus]